MEFASHTFSGDEYYMRRCLELAEKGCGSVSPNPMVGSVIVCDDQIIGEGYHERYGGPHAEVNAIASVCDEALLRRSTLYVNLEPCSHYGKTPPCSDLIIRKAVRRVVVGCLDPHEKVSGKGIEKLRRAGVEVTTGVLQRESEALNEAFIKSHTLAMPFVVLKIAQTIDGRIAVASGESKWITGEESRSEVHRMRSVYDAVMTTSSTVIADNPRLTVRHCEGRNPVRVVLDRLLQVPLSSSIFDDEAKTIVYTSHAMSTTQKAGEIRDKGVIVCGIGDDGNALDLSAVFRHLHDEHSLLSVMVEAGGTLAGSIIRQRLADRIVWFIAPKLFGADGLGAIAAFNCQNPADAPVLSFSAPRFFGRDFCIESSFPETP